MKCEYQIGDLVHIPQAVRLLDCDVMPSHANDYDSPLQFNIPTRVIETKTPRLGVITHVLGSGYIKVYCDGDCWSVKDESVYKL
jgi:hypothetical protein